jgi:hypothetical protein
MVAEVGVLRLRRFAAPLRMTVVEGMEDPRLLLLPRLRFTRSSATG